jgi:putative ABC transport system permease protein
MLRNYLTVAIKVLLRRKLFTAISLFGVSFTLVVLVVAVAILDHVFAPLPPEVHQDRSVGVYVIDMLGDGSRTHSNPGYKLLDRYVRNLPGVERMSISLRAGILPAYPHGSRVDSEVRRTDADFWRILQFTFLEGGAYGEDAVKRAEPLAVISASTRDKFFGGAPALGRTLELDRQRFRVVGVVPDVSPLRPLPYADVWVPLTTAPSDSYLDDLVGSGSAILLARSRADIPRMKEELRSRLSRWESPEPRNYHTLVVRLQTPFEFVASDLLGRSNRGDFESHPERLWTLLALVCGLFMLLPAVNLINLNVSRILERAPEIGVRKAFGASSRALVGQFVLENVLLTLVGGALALGLSALILRALTTSTLFGAVQFALNPRVFLIGLGLALVFGLISGVYPAWKMSRLHPVAALAGGSR